MSSAENRPPRRATRFPAGLLTALLLAIAVLSACGGGGNGRANPSRSPVPSFTPGKPGGTLRVVGSVRSVPLDPALARTDAALLVDRLIFRQLYSYRPGDPEPLPDLAAGSPALSSDRLTATITLRSARWNTTGGRNVTSGDVLRSMKRLCAPNILAPERGYLSQVVVGYADFCTKASRVRLGAGKQADLDNVDVSGLRAVGDDELQIVLRRPAADLRQILAMPALSPLPFEIKDGFPEPTSLINDGPYRFIEPESGEAYRLSRNASWDPAADPVRTALVDRVSFRGGLSAADVQQRLQTNNADLSWDVETPPEVLRTLPATPTPTPSTTAASPTTSSATTFPTSTTSFGTARVDDRGLALVAVGSRGPAARQLGVLAARTALAACLDRTALAGAFGGAPRATPTDALLTPDYLDVPDTDESSPAPSTAAPQPSATGSVPTSGGGQDPQSGSSPSRRASSRPSASPSASPTASGATAKPLTTAQCRAGLTTAGLRPGSNFTVLAGDSDAERAAADVLRKRLSAGGLAVQLRTVPSDRYGAVAALGGWDLGLIVERPEFAGSRAVLSPLLDPKWPGDPTAGAARRPSAWFAELTAGLAEDSADRVAKRELGLSSTLRADSSFVGVLRLATVRTTGPNVGQNPPLALLGNADPANVALGVTRPGESPSPMPASS